MTERPDQPGERVCERALIWHLGQLRTLDNQALWQASQEARSVFPVVVADPRDPLIKLKAYPHALTKLASRYRDLGAYLCYLEGDAEERVVDAARDARADHVYIAARHDEAGQALLARAKDSLEVWGFRCHVFYDSLFNASGEPRRSYPAPASLAGHPLPSEALPAANGTWDYSAEASWDTLHEGLTLGLLSPRLLWDTVPEHRDKLGHVLPAPIRGAGGIVFNKEGKVLLLRHQQGAWVFPKGHIDPGESELEAAQREVYEEAGIAASCLDEAVRLQTRYRNDRQEERLIDWFLFTTDAAAPICREALFPEGAFVTPDEALTRLTFPEDRRLLAEALAKRPRS
jgi:diadenosine hexaphosphate hydrolase (ATP-forming)